MGLIVLKETNKAILPITKLDHPIFNRGSSFLFFSSFPTYHMNPNFSMKLGESNLLIWHEQLKQVIVVYGLKTLISEIATILAKLVKKIVMVIGEDGNSCVCKLFDENPNFTLWDRQENTIKHYIYSYLSPSYLKHLINKNTTSEN